MAAPLLTTGKPVYLKRTIYDEGAAVNLTGYTIRCAFQNGKGQRITDIVTQDSATTGADWSTGVLAVYLTAAQAAGITGGPAYLEIEVTPPAGITRTLPLVECDVQIGSIA